jgi:LysR family transcriptional regulator, hydrogen peroxide-inducible genes activator
MTLQQLEYIVALDTERHFVKAAERCFVTQPTLTMQVKKMEEEIGVKIFERDSYPLKPTLVGEQIILKSRQILGEFSQLKSFLREEKEEIEGDFSIGIIPTLAPYLLPLFLPDFIKEYPKTNLIIKELQTESMILELQKGNLDLGILVSPLDVKNIREIALYKEEFLLYVPENHIDKYEENIKIEELVLDDLLLLEKGHCFREQALAICKNEKRNLKPKFQYESGSIETLKALVNKGCGFTLIPEMAADSENKKQVKRFEAPQPVREVSLVVHNSFTKEGLIAAFHKNISKNLPAKYLKAKPYTMVRWR